MEVPEPEPLDAVSLAGAVMSVADLNQNNELSYTELTEMLENTDFEVFGRWVKGRKQKGFREWDTDGQGTISLDELKSVAEQYVNEHVNEPKTHPLWKMGLFAGRAHKRH